MNRCVTCMRFNTTLVNSQLYRNFINVYIIIVLKTYQGFKVINYCIRQDLVKIFVFISIPVLSFTSHCTKKFTSIIRSLLKSFFSNIHIVTCLVQQLYLVGRLFFYYVVMGIGLNKSTLALIVTSVGNYSCVLIDNECFGQC